ncbi:hypothetical protein T310_2075 [Rasamsonia emersonii CBS 393.64]|uniref:Nephrocystin 3-like N-terminal domain-containing protein n=1 Tax=Rasamsonia emersonii (strain ATCC 16479 / CBS 393.64 / IMI 116815) TaxID=1408163 RepID=A0A0F4Z1B3_RASE3|nr:hypothetical protein T310_2075 [Rasamsonia emersonii CBS 393.64]KKA23891.1 hypothetical protein T310_2075 [Rasamsonia emersonii CBS 393.64]
MEEQVLLLEYCCNKVIRLHEPAVDFIDNKLRQSEKPFADSKAQYDPVPRQYIHSPRPSAHVVPAERGRELQAKYFAEALTAFQDSHPLPKSLAKSRFSIRNKPTWDAIFQEVKEAEAKYTAVNCSSKIHLPWRWVGKHAAGLKTYTAFIPSGTYTSILSVSLGIIFDAATRMQKLRATALEGLESVPGHLQNVIDYLEEYDVDERIHRATVAFYVAILAALEEVLVFYTKSADADESRMTIARLENYMLTMLRDRVQESEWKMEAARLLEELRKERRRNQRNPRSYQNLQKLFASRVALSPSPAPGGCIDQPQLFNLINIEPHFAEAGLQRVISACRNQSLALQSRALWLLRSQRLQQWLNSPHSDAVLIHGNSDPEKLSPVSFFCGLLIRSLADIEPARVVHFFCGIHSAPHDPLTGARGLLRSLIAQLLCQDGYDVAFLKRRDVHAIGCMELGALQDLFINLVAQLHASTVLFCVLDGINFYETDKHAIETGSVFRQIMDLVRADESRAVVKFLVTSPSKTRHVEQAFPAEDRITIPRTVANEGQELTGRMFLKAITPKAERMAIERDETA